MILEWEYTEYRWIVVLEQVDKNIKATADFLQQNIAGVQASNVKGELLANGNFVFSWIDGANRKMVLTGNNGEYVEHGYMPLGSISGSNWKNASNWSERSTDGFYSITNFVGKKGIHLSL